MKFLQQQNQILNLIVSHPKHSSIQTDEIFSQNGKNILEIEHLHDSGGDKTTLRERAASFPLEWKNHNGTKKPIETRCSVYDFRTVR